MARYDDGYTGHLYEEEVLGRCQAQHRGYMQWREAADLVRKNQPTRKAPCALSLEREVSRQLGDQAVFYTAVRSTLDVMHGCDGFFEFRGMVVTIDLTMNPHKDCGKADIIVHKDDVDDLPQLAGRIVRELRSKQQSRRW
jgi:hypothetical protein